MSDTPRPLIPVLDRVRNSRTEANMVLLGDALGYTLAATDSLATRLVLASRLTEDWITALSEDTDPETLADIAAERESLAEQLDAVLDQLRADIAAWRAATTGGSIAP